MGFSVEEEVLLLSEQDVADFCEGFFASFKAFDDPEGSLETSSSEKTGFSFFSEEVLIRLA